jgi:site-specific recombinase XerD
MLPRPRTSGKSILFDYLEALNKSGIRATSVNCYARSLNAFFKWLNDERYVTAEAGRDLKIKKLAVPIVQGYCAKAEDGPRHNTSVRTKTAILFFIVFLSS